MDKTRENGILVIAASLIAVIRLSGEPIKPSSSLFATFADSLHLTRTALKAVHRK